MPSSRYHASVHLRACIRCKRWRVPYYIYFLCTSATRCEYRSWCNFLSVNFVADRCRFCFSYETRNERVKRRIGYRRVVKTVVSFECPWIVQIARAAQKYVDFLIFAKRCVPDPSTKIQCRNGKCPGSPEAVHENPGNQECSRSNKISKRILSWPGSRATPAGYRGWINNKSRIILTSTYLLVLSAVLRVNAAAFYHVSRGCRRGSYDASQLLL